MDKSEYITPYKCIKDVQYHSDQRKEFTRGLVYKSYVSYSNATTGLLICFINNKGHMHNFPEDEFAEYFADVNYPLELL